MAQKSRSFQSLLPVPAFALAAFATLIGAGVGAGCNSLGIGSSGPPRQKGEPQFTGCISGAKLEKFSNCAEYCASQNLGCQNYGCKHPTEQGKTYGAMSFDNGLCSGAPMRAYQCNDPFVSDGAVECCCVGS